ncbi:DUF6082 family protein [Asanoa sp. NPDC050611]|uniref:DUF6082 family protein n=1 Tax=Asanoa sp. NPDC050611 TaxID=3157098 RepID=UPI0033E351B9
MGEGFNGRKALTRGRRVLSWAAALLIGVTIALLIGLAAGTLIAPTAPSSTWATLADVGESFGLLNAIFSGLALAAVVVTFWMQFTELRSQRSEIAIQRDALLRTQVELHRSAEANLRQVHMDLVKMSMDDPQLALVWPQVTNSDVRRRQYMYANLILQYNWLRVHISDVSEVELENVFRHLFLSPIMREYWTETATVRGRVVEVGSFEHRMTQVGDKICAEYEHLLEMQRTRQTEPTTWDDLGPVADAA